MYKVTIEVLINAGAYTGHSNPGETPEDFARAVVKELIDFVHDTDGVRIASVEKMGEGEIAHWGDQDGHL